jgi:hypothetical protein
VKAPWNKQLIDQCAVFPQGEFDDAVDALSMGLGYMKNYAPLSSSRVPIKRKIVTKQSDNMRGY